MRDLDRARALCAKAGRLNQGTKRDGTALWFATACGISHSTVMRWGENWPTWPRRVLELLEALPVEDWPPEWRGEGPR